MFSDCVHVMCLPFSSSSLNLPLASSALPLTIALFSIILSSVCRVRCQRGGASKAMSDVSRLAWRNKGTRNLNNGDDGLDELFAYS
jgi:hypothetical protein